MSTTIKLTFAALALASACASAGEQDGMVVVRDVQTSLLRNATPAEVKALRAQDATRRGTRSSPATTPANSTWSACKAPQPPTPRSINRSIAMKSVKQIALAVALACAGRRGPGRGHHHHH